MRSLLVCVFGLSFALAASLIAHDIFLFSEVRDRIDRAIADLTPSEAAPNAAVRAAFGLDDEALYRREAFALYRLESASRKWPNFHTNKVLTTPIWTLQLWIWYDRSSIEALRLKRKACSAAICAAGVDGVAVAAFGRGLNDLSAAELDCVVRLTRFGRGNRSRMCQAIARLFANERDVWQP